MSSRTVVALGHRFHELAEERAVLEPEGYRVVDGTKLNSHDRVEALRTSAGILLGSQPLSVEEFNAATECRGIVRYGVGVDNVDVHEATRRGMTVSRVPDYATPDVALHALSLALALIRRLPHADRSVRDGVWSLERIPPPKRVESLTFGVVGTGRIGTRVGELAAAVGFHVVGFDPVAPWSVFPSAGSLDELIAKSDVLSLHLPLTPDTAGLIGARELALLPHGAIVINTARGGLVEESALINALDSGNPFAAGLDVFADEPPTPSNALVGHPNVLVSPHMGWFSIEALASVKRQAAEEMLRILGGDEALWAVAPSENR